MIDNIQTGDRLAAEVTKQTGLSDRVPIPRAKYSLECYDKDGNLKWQDEAQNLVVDAGVNHALDVVLSAGAQTATWYIGLIEDTTYSAIAAADTLASHAGWVECTAYAGDRKAFADGGVSAKSLSNTASKASFTINATKTLKGAFMCAAATLNTAILYNAGLFTGGDRAVVDTDVVLVTATFTGADDGV